jgi:hypothetical protein
MQKTTIQKTMILGLLGTLLCTASAQAQTTPTADDTATSKPITIKLGAFLPSGSGTKNALGNTWFAVGGEYAFAKPGTSVMPIAFIDYTGKSKTVTVDNGVGGSADINSNASSFGIGGGIRAYGNAGSSVTPFYGAGVGVYFNHYKANVNDATLGNLGDFSKNKTSIGFKLNVGAEFQKMYFVEADYFNAGKVNVVETANVEFSGINLLVGARF